MTIDEIQHKIIKEMGAMRDWFEKYEYLVDLGKRLKPIDDAFKSEQYQIDGCQSQVWIVAKVAGNRLQLTADSDSLITRGIISLLLRVLDGQPLEEVQNADLFFIKDIGLSTNLSPSRANGLTLIIQKIKWYAKNSISN